MPGAVEAHIQKVHSDGDTRSVTRLQPAKSSTIMDLEPVGSTNRYQRVTPAQMKQLNEVRMQALKSEFDSMEESLRDALRQECRQNSRIDSKRSPVCDSTITKRHNYITVYEHDQRQPSSIRNPPNFVDPQGHRLTSYSKAPPLNASPTKPPNIGNISVDEFQRYCSLLTDRIQKMEEQNVELIKLAEQQKTEYEKVVAQVMESEKSQRLLLSECNSLRQQVQQLANHNRKLKEQHLLNNSPSSSSSSETRKDTSVIRGNGSPNSPVPTENKAESPKEALQQLHGHSVSLLESYKIFDIASIVELYAALQKETLTDISSPAPASGQTSSLTQQKAGFLREQATSRAGNISHKREESDRTAYEDPDYASPSNICAAPSCTRCITGSHSSSKGDHCNSQLHDEVPTGVPEVSRQRNRRSSETSNSSKDVHCFDNNSYVEVEIKSGRSLQNSLASSVEDQAPYYVRQNKLGRPHNDYTNVSIISSQDYPSNMALDEDSSEVFLPDMKNNTSNYQRSPPVALANSPASSSRKTLSTSSNEHKTDTTDSQLYKETKMQYSQRTKLNSRPKKYSRSSSTSELPPPPPPPPSTSEDGKNATRGISHNSLSSPTLCGSSTTKQASDSRGSRSNELNKQASPSIENAEFFRKLDLWKDLDRVLERPLMENDKMSDEETNIGGRRGSYSRACRKSQSLDHLYEQAIVEPQNETSCRISMENENMESLSKCVSPRLQNHTNENNLSPLLQHSRFKNGNRGAPSPTFIVQESACTTSSHEEVMPARLLKASNQRHNMEAKTGGTTSSPPQSQIAKNTVQSYVHKFSSSANASEMTSAFSDDRELVFANKERMRNRRFSEGSTGNKQKDRIFQNANQGQIRRYRSVDSDHAANKPRETGTSRLQAPSTPSCITNKSYGSYRKEASRQNYQQPRFPATNPYARADSSVLKNETDWAKNHAPSSKHSKLNERTSGIPSAIAPQQFTPSQSSSADGPKPSPVSASVVMQNIAKGAAEEMNCSRASKKEAKPNKHNNTPVAEDKKKGPSRGQSKSFVSLMKAKFSRSTSSGRSSSSSDKQTKALSSFPVTPASSLIDPRTLSLEPNSYPPTKDGKKGSKQSTDQDSEAAIGRKLSQPFPNGYGEILHQLHSLPEETFPDEGFAEGSTIERPGKPEAQTFLNTFKSNTSPKVNKTQSYVNVDLPKDKVLVTQGDLRSPKPAKHQATTSSYENITPKQLRKPSPSRYENQSTSSFTNINVYSAKVKQQHGRNQSKFGERSPYENCLPNAVEKSQENGTLRKQRIVSDVQLALSCSQRKAVPLVAQPITKSSIIDFEQIQISTPLVSVPENNNPNHDKTEETEKEFINSMVKAELEHRLNDRNLQISPPHNSISMSDAPLERLPCSSMSSVGESMTTESIGTISSIGSFPSDPFESSNSADGNNNTSSGSLESPSKEPKVRSEQPNAQPSRIKKKFVKGPFTDESPVSKIKLPSSKFKSTSSPTSKENTSQSMIARFSKNPNFHQNSYSRSKSEEGHRTTTSPSIVTPKKSHIAYRSSKIASAPGSKLPSAGKSTDIPSSGIKTPEKIPPLQAKSKISPITHLHFIPIPSATTEKNRFARKQFLCTQPVYENVSMIKQHEK